MKRHLFRDLGRYFRSPASLRYAIAVARKFGGIHPRLCNLCGHEGLFHAYGHPPRYDAACPGCGSRERQRLFALLLAARPELGRGRVVHVAPEAEIVPLLKARADSYVTADVAAPGVDRRIDLMAIDLPDGSVDLFVAHHVLEHVADDRGALAELHRCLAPGGAALLSVPIAEGWTTTYEDPAITAPAERDTHFGRIDHVRFYGADFPARLASAGFAVETFTAAGPETARHSLFPGDRIFIARKP